MDFVDRVTVLCLVFSVCAEISFSHAATTFVALQDAIVFPSDEHDARSSTRQHPPPFNKTNSEPRFGYDGSGGKFNVKPSSNGGFSASGSFSNNFASNNQHGSSFGVSQSASQSHSFSINAGGNHGANGFSASQAASASQSASFNGHSGYGGSSLSASQANSQSSSFSGGGGGGGYGGSASSASSQAASAGFSGGGGGGGGGGSASFASGASNSQSHGYNPYDIPPEFVRVQRPNSSRERYDRRRGQRPTNLVNSWLNPYWTARARTAKPVTIF